MAANDVPCCESMFWVYLFICVALVGFAGLMSGLTLGLMSLSLFDLEVQARAGRPDDRKKAEKILPLVKNQHLLLCTLLIYNAMAMEALPIFLDSILPAWCSVLISVTLILAFGEIIPQAICSRYGLSVGAKLAPIVRLLVIIIYPISYPISKLLDFILGKSHSELLKRSELKTFVDLHGNEAGKGGELSHDETAIIAGALELSQKTAKDAMTPISRVFSLDINAKLDKETVELIMKKGHSRVPIFSGSPANIIGIILVKNLVAFRAEEEMLIRNLTIRKIPRLHEHLPLYDILNDFQKGNSHMGVVVKSSKRSDDCVISMKKKTGAGTAYPVLTEMRINGNLVSERKGVKHEGGQVVIEEHRKRENKVQNPVLNSDDIFQDDMVVGNAGEEVVIGIITLEDVMEELLQEEIFDEKDADIHSMTTSEVKTWSLGSSVRTSPTPTPTPSVIISPIPGSYHSSHQFPHPAIRSPASPYALSPLARPSRLISSPSAISSMLLLGSPKTTQSTPTFKMPNQVRFRLDKPGSYIRSCSSDSKRASKAVLNIPP